MGSAPPQRWSYDDYDQARAQADGDQSWADLQEEEERRNALWQQCEAEVQAQRSARPATWGHARPAGWAHPPTCTATRPAAERTACSSHHTCGSTSAWPTVASWQLTFPNCPCTRIVILWPQSTYRWTTLRPKYICIWVHGLFRVCKTQGGRRGDAVHEGHVERQLR